MCSSPIPVAKTGKNYTLGYSEKTIAVSNSLRAFSFCEVIVCSM